MHIDVGREEDDRLLAWHCLFAELGFDKLGIGQVESQFDVILVRRSLAVDHCKAHAFLVGELLQEVSTG